MAVALKSRKRSINSKIISNGRNGREQGVVLIAVGHFGNSNSSISNSMNSNSTIIRDITNTTSTTANSQHRI